MESIWGRFLMIGFAGLIAAWHFWPDAGMMAVAGLFFLGMLLVVGLVIDLGILFVKWVWKNYIQL